MAFYDFRFPLSILRLRYQHRYLQRCLPGLAASQRRTRVSTPCTTLMREHAAWLFFSLKRFGKRGCLL